jgi:hypothetical protein
LNDQSSYRATEAVAPDVNKLWVARSIYGLITVLAVLEAMEHHPPSAAWRGAVILFGTTLAVALVEAYADSIAEMIARGGGLSRADMIEIGHDVAPVLIGAQGPTVVFVLAALGLFSVERAIDIAQTVAFVSLFGYGWRIGKLLHEQRHKQLISGLILVAIGGLVVGIKAAFH